MSLYRRLQRYVCLLFQHICKENRCLFHFFSNQSLFLPTDFSSLFLPSCIRPLRTCAHSFKQYDHYSHFLLYLLYERMCDWKASTTKNRDGKQHQQTGFFFSLSWHLGFVHVFVCSCGSNSMGFVMCALFALPVWYCVFFFFFQLSVAWVVSVHADVHCGMWFYEVLSSAIRMS